jgi:hypothetical protein
MNFGFRKVVAGTSESKEAEEQSVRQPRSAEVQSASRMPCSCQIPVPHYPDNAEWGPILWSILHGLAERAGTGINRADEIREWQRLLKVTGEMLPCDRCREHYKQYSQQNPTSSFNTSPNLNTSVKTWLWNLHNEVNKEYGKPEYPYEDLTPTYKSVNLQDLFWRLDPVIKKSIQLNGISLMKWTTWIHSFKMMRSILMC